MCVALSAQHCGVFSFAAAEVLCLFVCFESVIGFVGGE